MSETNWKNLTPQQRKVLVAKYVGDPSTRTKIPTRYLPTKYRDERIANRSPITPGSSITGGQLTKRANAAATLQYGSTLSDAQKAAERAAGVARDTQGWYDQYLQELERARQNTVGANQAADGTIRGLQGSISGLSQPSAQDAAANGGSAQNQTDASNAAAIRQALGASLGGRQAGLGAASNNYANTLAHVVGPGQKLQAAAIGAQQVKDAEQKVSDVRSQIGAYKQNYRSQVLDAENKNLLAEAIAANKTQAQIASDRLAAQTKIKIANANNRTKASVAAGNNAAKLSAAALRKSGKGGSSSKGHPGGADYGTTAQQAAYWNKVEQGASLLGKKDKAGRPWTVDGLIAAGWSRAQAHTAYSLHRSHGRYITTGNARGAHQHGVLVGGRYKVNDKPTAYVNGPRW